MGTTDIADIVRIALCKFSDFHKARRVLQRFPRALRAL